MWSNNKIYLEDIEKNVYDSNIKWEKLKNKVLFITGGTGLIGSLIINTILYANKIKGLNCKIIALVRDKEKSSRIFENLLSQNLGLKLIYGDVCNKIEIPKENIDYIIHAASQTSSKLFVNNPIETINVALKGTQNMLELAKTKNVENFIYLSTMEVYGRPKTDEKINEMHGTDLLTNEVRNCYPISKIMCENLCTCYSKQFNFNTNILRLTQTFGAGVNYSDGRVFAEFARCVIENKNIVLHTKGDTKRSYLYTSDAVNAILLIMLSGTNNEIYNVANDKTYCSILDMANLVSKKNKDIKVECIVDEDIEKFGYAPTLCMNLDTTKIKNIGWEAKIGLEEMYDRLIKFLCDER